VQILKGLSATIFYLVVISTAFRRAKLCMASRDKQAIAALTERYVKVVARTPVKLSPHQGYERV
jgi:hypothetical protein